jgi:hypothetical protein
MGVNLISWKEEKPADLKLLLPKQNAGKMSEPH